MTLCTPADGNGGVHCADCPVRQWVVYAGLADQDPNGVEGLRKTTAWLPAHRLILSKGETSKEIYVIREGWAVRFDILPKGDRQIFGFLAPGDVIGLQSMRTDEATESVETLTPATVCVFDRDLWIDCLGHAPDYALSIVRYCLLNLAHCDTRVADLGRRNAAERVARLLLDLFARARMRGLASDGELPIVLRQNQMSAALGLSPVHVNRTIKQMRADGLIGRQAGRIEIRDVRKLAAIAGYIPPYYREALPELDGKS
jgi:CRP/FNR family transcriptional regulator